jgi:lipid-A-disaccharide synthase
MGDRPLRIALVVGEESGDQLGAGLVDAIRRVRPDTSFVGVAGPRLEARGVTSVIPLADIAVMGLGSILSHLPRILRRLGETVAAVLAAEPDALVIVDSPEFTHAVARRVARRNPALPIIDYVSPSVWAWRPGRARRMTRYVDHVLALLPFEPEAHRRLGGPPCTYVGHALIDRLDVLQPTEGERASLADRPVLLILPGSRQTEISRLMPPFGEAAGLIANARPETELLLPAVPHLVAEIEAHLKSWPVRATIVEGEAAKFAAFRRAHAALAASGTVTLELGLSGVPMVVAYRVDPIARLLKRFLSVPSIVLANLIIGENAIPEYLDEAGSPAVLAGAVLPLLREGNERAAQLAALARLQGRMALSEEGTPSERAATIVLEAATAGAGRRAARIKGQRRAEIGR